MQFLSNTLYGLIWGFLFLTLFGLYRPWLALWWLDQANRKKVLTYYGLPLLALFVLYVLVR